MPRIPLLQLVSSKARPSSLRPSPGCSIPGLAHIPTPPHPIPPGLATTRGSRRNPSLAYLHGTALGRASLCSEACLGALRGGVCAELGRQSVLLYPRRPNSSLRKIIARNSALHSSGGESGLAYTSSFSTHSVTSHREWKEWQEVLVTE